MDSINWLDPKCNFYGLVAAHTHLRYPVCLMSSIGELFDSRALVVQSAGHGKQTAAHNTC